MNTPDPIPLDAMECGLTVPETQQLRSLLQDHRAHSARSSQHESWAWTRLQSRLRHPSPSNALLFWRWAAAGSVAALTLVWILQSPPHQSSVPIAETQNPRVWASGFHFRDAKADVIWATGYDYIPASYSVK